MITLEEYCDFVDGLASPNSMASFEAKLTTGGLGIAGEAGEVADIVKKIVFHGMDYTDEVRDRIIKELGDVMWYIAFTANTISCPIDEIIDANVEKLQDRYKSGKFSREEFMKKEQAKMS